ncbi:MAG: hypothetical protein ACEPOV_09515 [Hyphomicrobiales bacterium]
MRIKLNIKSAISSLKKVILKLKDKLALCPKQSSQITQTYNEVTQETQITHTSFYNCIDALLSIINRSIQKKKNTTTKWGNSINTIEGIIKSEIATFNFRIHTKQKIHKDLTNYKRSFAYIVGNTNKKRLSRLFNIG